MVVSQRPSEIDETILSQCGTIVAMRLANPTDRSRVVASAPDNLSGLLSMLPILRTGEALVLGEAVSLPMRVLIDQPAPELRPVSDDPLVIDPAGEVPGGWDRRLEPSDFSDVMYTWRQQSPQSQRLIEATHDDEEE